MKGPAKKVIPRKEAPRNEVRCFNCDRSNHLAVNSPSKKEGPKCREFGHSAANCKEGQNVSKVSVHSVTNMRDNKVYKPIIVVSKEIIVLLDI
ncbi:hypothetical protein K0M31_001117 [Melipona bicolor]|uniref:Uncharacterized protein n=1 Tax=Melipona bicolor TaxID=60889 RepID=A0AA40GEV5_9HYME|nr:hypothetical protein K0M31_001117 [Melipona bicolor]